MDSCNLPGSAKRALISHRQSLNGTSLYLSGAIMSNHADREKTGIRGAELVTQELISRGYRATLMAPYNRGFDISCGSPTGRSFKVEVKCSTSTGTQVPLQTKSHLDAPLQSDLFYVFVRLPDDPSGVPEFYIMTQS